MRELTQDCNILLKACHGDMRVVPEGIYPRCIAVTQCNIGLIFRQFIFFDPTYPKLFLFVVVRVWQMNTGWNREKRTDYISGEGRGCQEKIVWKNGLKK